MIKAYAKVNLRLKVVGKRPNGYHDLEMINISVDLSDSLSIKKNKSGDIIIRCNNPLLPTDDNNIVHKVVKYIKETYQISDGFEIMIDKKIPIGAGLGGGSSDAAAMINWFNNEYRLNLSEDALIGLALKFGADVPYCLYGQPAIVTGIGKEINFIKLNLPKYLLLITPPINVSTKEIFNDYDRLISKENSDLNYRTNIYKKQKNNELMENDLMEVTFNKHPILEKMKRFLESLSKRKVMMSGSGPSLFCLFDSLNEANQIKDQYQERYPNHYINVTQIINVEK